MTLLPSDTVISTNADNETIACVHLFGSYFSQINSIVKMAKYSNNQKMLAVIYEHEPTNILFYKHQKEFEIFGKCVLSYQNPHDRMVDFSFVLKDGSMFVACTLKSDRKTIGIFKNGALLFCLHHDSPVSKIQWNNLTLNLDAILNDKYVQYDWPSTSLIHLRANYPKMYTGNKKLKYPPTNFIRHDHCFCVTHSGLVVDGRHKIQFCPTHKCMDVYPIVDITKRETKRSLVLLSPKEIVTCNLYESGELKPFDTSPIFIAPCAQLMNRKSFACMLLAWRRNHHRAFSKRPPGFAPRLMGALLRLDFFNDPRRLKPAARMPLGISADEWYEWRCKMK